MGTVAEILNKYLNAIYDTDDSIYKSLVANIDGVPEVIIENPIDFNIGVIADVLEWTRQLSICLIQQLFLNEAEGKFLDLMVHNHIGIVRFENESDIDYSERVKNYIIAHKVSRASVIYFARPYSSPGEPELLDGIDDAAFADLSYSDVYTSFQNEAANQYEDWWVFPAITSSIGDTAYFFVLRLENTDSADIAKVIDFLDRWKAGGIAYELQIITV